MPPPSPLSISTSSLLRLHKELLTYHTELSNQQTSLEKSKARSTAVNGHATEDDNLKYQIAQEERAIEETKKMFAPLGLKVEEARKRLESQLEGAEGTADDAEVRKAKEALDSTKGESM